MREILSVLGSLVVLCEYNLVSTQLERSRASACTLTLKPTKSTQILEVILGRNSKASICLSSRNWVIYCSETVCKANCF